jgi:hypothetical protein
MSSLALRLHKNHVVTSMGAVATLQQVANESGKAITKGQRIELTIPANWGNSVKRVNVEPGRWLVEATLPSGEVISEEVAVGSGEDLPVTLHSAEHSPHEWLGLQYLVGNIEGADTLRRTLSTKDATLPTSAAGAARRARASAEPPNVQTWQKQGALRGIEAWTDILSPDTNSLLPTPAPFAGDGAGWQVLFDGTVESFRKWRRVGSSSGSNTEPPCDFRYVDGQILTVGGGDHALFWYAPEAFSNFVLKLQFRVFTTNANSGIFLRIRDPRKPLPEPIKSLAQRDLDTYNNLAWTAVHSGFEVQIDDAAPLKKNRTGAIYDIPAGDPGDAQLQTYQLGPPLIVRPWPDQAGWFEYEIRVLGPDYDVKLAPMGGPKTQTTLFNNGDTPRGVPASADPLSGFIALQSHNGSRVAFRNIQIKKL